MRRAGGTSFRAIGGFGVVRERAVFMSARGRLFNRPLTVLGVKLLLFLASGATALSGESSMSGLAMADLGIGMTGEFFGGISGRLSACRLLRVS